LQIGAGTSGTANFAGGGTKTLISSNQYYNGSVNKYINNGYAQAMVLDTDSSFSWIQAESGTAGNTASFFTKMTLDVSGNLLVGTTTSTPASITAHKLVVERTASVFGAAFGYTPDSTARTQVTLYNSNGAVGTISTSGSATSYNTTSDQRLKENIVDAPEFGSVIDSIQVRSYDWKSNGSHQRAGFIAQELVTVAPEAVHQPVDTDEMMAVDYSKLVPMLVKEIQSLRKRLAALESN
jgi:hypothetical protein